MDLMKDINHLANEYTPAEQEAVDEGMKNMMLKAMDAERAKRKMAALPADEPKKTKKKDSIVAVMKKKRKENNWK